MLRHACRLSLEGVVSKQRDAAYPVGPHRVLDQVEVLRPPGVRRRRLRPVVGLERPRSARWCSATTRTASSSTPAGSAPASAARWPRDLFGAARAAAPQEPAVRPKAHRRGERAASSGSSPSSSPRSSSAPGPPTASCATPPSAACARTSPRARSPARRRPRPRRPRSRRSA